MSRRHRLPWQVKFIYVRLTIVLIGRAHLHTLHMVWHWEAIAVRAEPAQGCHMLHHAWCLVHLLPTALKVEAVDMLETADLWDRNL